VLSYTPRSKRGLCVWSLVSREETRHTPVTTIAARGHARALAHGAARRTAHATRRGPPCAGAGEGGEVG